MKKMMITLVAVLYCAMNMTVLTACTTVNDDNPATPPEPEPIAEYTITV